MAKGTNRRIDIHTVANRANVSIATVSRVINGVGTVNRAMTSRVQRAIAELGYSPNTHARSLVSGRSRIIGLIVTLITNPFYPELIQNFETLAAESGYDILIGSTNYRPERKLDCLRRMEERKVDGIAMMTFGADDELLRSLVERRFPVVSIGSSGLRGVQPIQVNFDQGIHEAVQHLAVLGHRRIAFISGPLRVDNSLARQTAFFEAMRAIGARIPKGYVFEGDHSMESGFRATEKMLALSERPTAILCSNDMTAIGALHAVCDRKMHVPEDISIVGFDDIQMAQYTVPPLTSVRMSGEDIARVALAILIPMIEGGNAPQQEVVPTQLIVRKSTGYAPAANALKSPPRRKQK